MFIYLQINLVVYNEKGGVNKTTVQLEVMTRNRSVRSYYRKTSRNLTQSCA